MHAFCISSVAATKSAKDKGFSRFFMGAKVGREELCQGGGVLFCVSNERRYFALGDIDEGGIEGLAKGWSVAPFLLRGKRGCLSRSLWGEGWFFWAGGGDEVLGRGICAIGLLRRR